MDHRSINEFRAAIVRAFPSLAESDFRILAQGWHSTAVEVDRRLIFKFPKSDAAKRALIREAALLDAVGDLVTLPVPRLRIADDPPVFSYHEKLRGEYLPAERYRELSDEACDRLGRDLGRFYAELHQLDVKQMIAAGTGPIERWQTAETVRSRALPMLPPDLRSRSEETVSAFERLPPDPYGAVYGFFDGHGWNMAFDYERNRLNGIYDFADSGIGPLHQEFIYSNFISADLTERIVTAYEALTGRSLDRRRIAVLTGFHRLSELAELADDPEHAPTMVRHVAAWVAATDQRS